ncbi:MAG: hypothetical protein CMP11_02320 [Zetaproteobacteria bacterium]|nr:hypothetical protein [Pseudobdellovibrionaceae bacterium]|tara:strand:- start:885 stop:2489 length:1605 start_codon:yes stop_codon:yes gene_type:complete
MKKEKDSQIIAAIDVGSNSIHLVVAQIDDSNNLQVLDTDKTSVRLGGALDAEKRINKQAVQKTVEAITHMKEIAAVHEPNFRAVATHAVRSATNQLELIQEIKKVSGIDVAIIDGIEEARLISLGMLIGLPLDKKTFLGVDVGGGSTEFIVTCNESIKYVSSLQLGAVTLSQRFLYEDKIDGLKPKKSDVVLMERYAAMQLAPVCSEVNKTSFDTAVISSGAAKTLALIHAKEQSQPLLLDPNGYVLTVEAINSIYNKIKSLRSPSAIKSQWGLDQARSEIILAGVCVLNLISNLLGVKKWVVSGFALREGLVLDTYRRLRKSSTNYRDGFDIRWNSILSLGKRCQIDTHQAEQVLKHSLSLYKGLEDSKVDTYDDDDDSLLSNRELLRAGSQLHECGKFISQQRFHHHSFYIISNSRLLGFSQKERLIIGLIARFWRKGTLRLIREDYKFLSARDVDRIQLLSSLIRIAVAGNRTRKGLIDNLYLSKIKSDFYLHIKLKNPKIPIRVDFQKIETEKSVLEKILQKDVHLEVLS